MAAAKARLGTNDRLSASPHYVGSENEDSDGDNAGSKSRRGGLGCLAIDMFAENIIRISVEREWQTSKISKQRWSHQEAQGRLRYRSVVIRFHSHG